MMVRQQPAIQRLMRAVKTNYQLYLCLLLPMIWLIIFCYLPMSGLLMAFEDFKASLGIFGSEWIGFDNFTKFFQSPSFGSLIGNTFTISLLSLIAGFPLPVILAVMLNSCKNNGLKKTVQMITYAPYFISTVVLVSMIIQFLSPRTGFYAQISSLLGFQAQNLMGDPQAFIWIYIISGIWQGTGYGAIIYIAALAGIDPTLYEAATVDGASKLQKIWHIDLPGIVPTMITMLILNAGSILNVGFEKIFLMQNPLNLSASEVISTYIYKMGMLTSLPDYGFTTAVGMFNSVINLVMIVFVNFIANKTTNISIF